MIIEIGVLIASLLLLVLVPWWLIFGLSLCSLFFVRGYGGLIASLVLDVVALPHEFPYLSIVFMLAMVIAGWVKSRMLG